jgi:ribose 5-phosphate isomerase A
MNTPQPPAEVETLKRDAAVRAADWIEDGMVLGLGTGSTVRYLLEHIAARRAEGAWPALLGIPTSRATEEYAQRLEIPLTTLDLHPRVDLTIDGADEVDPQFRLIKGLGGALLREKIVASCSQRLVIIVDASKLVERLGTRSPLPVEVEPFGLGAHLRFLQECGARTVVRHGGDGTPFCTDGGHHIVDCHLAGGIADPESLDRDLRARAGILETGLFLGMTDDVVIAAPEGVREMRPHSPPRRAT